MDYPLEKLWKKRIFILEQAFHRNQPESSQCVSEIFTFNGYRVLKARELGVPLLPLRGMKADEEDITGA